MITITLTYSEVIGILVMIPVCIFAAWYAARITTGATREALQEIVKLREEVSFHFKKQEDSDSNLTWPDFLTDMPEDKKLRQDLGGKVTKQKFSDSLDKLGEKLRQSSRDINVTTSGGRIQ